MTLQDRIWANRIQNLPEINEDHMVGKTVTLGHRLGTVTKEVGDNATGEVYEVEMEDGTTITAGAHEMIITDPAAGTGEPSTDIQATGVQEGTGSGDGCAEATKEEEVEETYEDEEEPADYDEFFQAALKKFGVESPEDFKSDEDKKEFFNYIEKNWTGEKKESVEFTAKELAHFNKVLDI
jgi:hypothetical protein